MTQIQCYQLVLLVSTCFHVWDYDTIITPLIGSVMQAFFKVLLSGEYCSLETVQEIKLNIKEIKPLPLDIYLPLRAFL